MVGSAKSGAKGWENSVLILNADALLLSLPPPLSLSRSLVFSSFLAFLNRGAVGTRVSARGNRTHRVHWYSVPSRIGATLSLPDSASNPNSLSLSPSLPLLPTPSLRLEAMEDRRVLRPREKREKERDEAGKERERGGERCSKKTEEEEEEEGQR